MRRIAVLEYAEPSRGRISRLLRDLEHTPVLFDTCAQLLHSLQKEQFDLLLLNWNLADMNGFNALAWAKANIEPSPPAIIVTARSHGGDEVTALTAGADDYITKPILESVFKARVEAVLRRTYGLRIVSKIEAYGNYDFALASRQVSIDGRPVTTTLKVFNLALLLFRNMSRPLSRSDIAQTLWTSNIDPEGRTLDVHIAQVRRQLGLIPENGFRLSAVYRFGYRLERVEEQPTLWKTDFRSTGLNSLSFCQS
jgi:DNA-binding response OmpR family regulator